MSSFFVDRLYSGTRLDQFLAERLIVFSRSAIQRAIDQRRITVNGKSASSHYKIRFKDKIIFDDASFQETARPEPVKEHRHHLPKPTVVTETPHYFIIEKPSGWLMHATSGHDTAPLLSDFLVDLDPALAVVGDKPELRPGIVHRLDKDVSGLLVVPRTQEFFDHIKKQFIDHDVVKTYHALVFGKPTKDEDTIHFRIARSKKKARMAAIPVDTPDGKTAATHFVVEERFQHSCLLRVWVKTGRTNQIRVHLAAYNLPIVGDVQYGKRTPSNSAVGRVMLHADYISFFELNGTKVEFSSTLPRAFAELVEKGRKGVAAR